MANDSALEKKRPDIGVIALIIAGLLAAAAIGVAVFRGQSDEVPDAATSSADIPEGAPDVNEVIAGLEMRLRAQPDDAEGWRMLGWSYYETQRYAESATAMKRATSLDPDNAEYFSMLGEALLLSGKGGEQDTVMAADAHAAFKRAHEIDPKDARARYFLAAAKDMNGNHTEAINDWFALLADTPADAPYAQDIRNVIQTVGKERGIEVDSRLASAKFAPAKNGFETSGPDIASKAIPGPTSQQMRDASQLPQGAQEEMIRDMVDGLDAKLKADPSDADRWIMLMRSRVTLGETAKAQKAYNDAQNAFRNDGAKLKKIKEAAAVLGIK